MMWALNVTRSMTAATSRASVMIWPHSLNGRLLASPIEDFLLPLGQHLEQQLGAAGVELDVADLVDQSRSKRP